MCPLNEFLHFNSMQLGKGFAIYKNNYVPMESGTSVKKAFTKCMTAGLKFGRTLLAPSAKKQSNQGICNSVEWKTCYNKITPCCEE